MRKHFASLTGKGGQNGVALSVFFWYILASLRGGRSAPSVEVLVEGGTSTIEDERTGGDSPGTDHGRPGYQAIDGPLCGNGRSVADKLNIPKIGLIGILLLAKERGLLKDIGPFMDELRDKGYWLSDELTLLARRLAGEYHGDE